MQALALLWLPVLVAAIAVFVASSLVHMVFRWHQSDYRRLGNEEAVRTALRQSGDAPGQYHTPWCEGMKEAHGEALQAGGLAERADGVGEAQRVGHRSHHPQEG